MAQTRGSSLVSLEGFDELIDRLDAMPVELGVKRKVTAKALRAGAKLIQNEAKRRAPYHKIGRRWSPASARYGPLTKNIVVAVVESNADGAEAQVGITSRGFYGKFHEYGTAHQPARPWLGPSFDAKLDEALEIVATEMDEGIQKAFNG